MSDTRRFDPIIVDISYSSMAAGCMRIMLAGGGVELDKGGRLTGKIGEVFGRSVGVAPLLVIFSFVLRSGLTHGPQTLSRLSAAVRLRSMATTAIYSKRSVSKTSTAPEIQTEYQALGDGKSSTSSVLALAAIAMLSGIANGYNGFVLEGALPRLRASSVALVTSAWQSGLLGGSLSIGGFLGSLACTELAYRVSRRTMVVFGEVIIIISVASFSLATDFNICLGGRILTGIGVGICGLAKPLIVSEQSPPHLRGFLVSLFAVGQSIGLNIFYVVDALLPSALYPWAWRVLVALGATPALLVVLLALHGASSPPSVYWDIAPSRTAAQHTTAQAVTPAEESGLRSAQESAPKPVEAPSLRTLMAEPFETRRNFGLIVALMFGYNLSGTLVIANYAGELFASAGASGRTLPIVIGAVQFLGLLSAAWGTDRIGRRPLLLWSCAITSLCLWSIAALIGLQEVLDPVLPHDVQTLLLLALMAAVEYAVGAGLNPVRIVLSAELMPNRYRSLGMSLGNAVGWGLALLSLMFFPVLTALLGGAAPQFAFFGTVVAALTLLLIVYLPETKGINFG